MTSTEIDKSIGAVKWVYLQTILPKVLTPLVSIVLARLLTPSFFALVAIASTTISLLDILRDMGMSRALIQSEEDEDTVFNVVFWINLVFGVIFYVLLFIGAPLISRFFHNSDVIPILRVLGFQLVNNTNGIF